MNDRWLTLHPVLPPAFSVGVMLLLALTFCWFEWRRKSRYRALRFSALMLLLLSIAGILFRPAIKAERTQNSILLTAGYVPQRIDSLLRVYPGLTLIHAPGVQGYKNSIALNSWHELSYSRKINFVAGEGLPASAAGLLAERSFQFIPCGYPVGVIALHTEHTVRPKRTATISGVYHAAEQPTVLYLEGPGGKEDSVTLSKQGMQPFALRFTTKEPGNFLYTLRSGDGMREKIPVHVEEHRPANILFIQHYPTFESRYLKSMLAEEHSLMFRYTLSKNTHRYEFVNRKPQALERLTAGSLLDFDLLIIDSDALRSLSTAETNALRQSIRSGLGMIILFNESPLQIKSLKTFLPITFRPVIPDTAKFTLATGSITLPAWPLTAVAGQENHLVSVLRNKNRILSGYHTTGFGKTGFQLLQETYRLFLKGDSAGYSAVWSALLEPTMRSQNAAFNIKMLTPFPMRVDEPISVEVTTSGTSPEVMKDNIPIPMMEDSRIDDRWTGNLWVDRPGWHTVKLNNDSAQIEFYCPEKDAWATLASANRINFTRQKASSTMNNNARVSSDEPVVLWIFYLLFLTGAGFLWLAPKLS